MSEYHNPRAKKEPEKSSAHADIKENVQYYQEVLEKIDLSEETLISIQKVEEDWLCALIPHGPIGGRKGCFRLDFNQQNKDFRREFSSLLDTMKQKGMFTWKPRK